MTTKTAGRTTDARFLRLFTGGLTVQQIESSVEDVMKRISVILKSDYEVKKRLSINIKKGESQGYAYLFVEDSRYTNILAGLNADGTKREEKVQDPNWVPGAKKKQTIDFDNLSWAEISELEDEEEKADMPVMISKKLAPLVEFKQYKYTNMQKSDHHRVVNSDLHYKEYTKMKTEAERKGKVLKLTHDEIMSLKVSEVINVPDTFCIEVSFAHVSDHEYDDTYKHNVLFAKGFPAWVQESDIYNAMANLASTNATTTIKHTLKNGKVEKKTVSYPLVNIVRKGDQAKAFITFDPRTRDARFALMVCIFLTIEGSNKQRTSLRLQKAMK